MGTQDLSKDSNADKSKPIRLSLKDGIIPTTLTLNNPKLIHLELLYFFTY